MFSTVARPARAPRRLGPLLLSVLLNGGSIAALFALGAREVERVVEAEVSLERPYDLRVPEPAGGGAPAPKAAAKAVKRAPPAPVAAPVQPPTVAAPEMAPADATLAAVADATVGEAGGDGLSGGGGGGDGGGSGGGTGDGEGPGNGGGPRVVHWSEVQVRTRATVRPSDYPAAASALRLPETRCVVRIAIDATGRPVDVAPRSCPEVFRASAEAVALRYRFWPLRDEAGRAIPAAFDLGITFQPDR